MLLSKGMTGSMVCEKIGCSPASLQVWKKDYKDGKISRDDVDDGRQDDEQDTPPHKTACCSSQPTASREEFIKQYWRTQSVDAVMKMPESIDEVVKLINNALMYAHNHLSD